MASNENPRQPSAVAGEQLKKFREIRGLRQEDIADMAREYGLTWGRSSVASLEAGNRELSFGELVLLPTIIKRLGGWDEAIIPPTTIVALSESTSIPAHQIPGHVLALLAPTAAPKRTRRNGEILEDEDFLLGGVENRNDRSTESRRETILGVSVYEYMFYKLWPESATRYTLRAGGFEVDRRVAERITTPDGKRADSLLVAAFAQALYGHSVGDERDARANARGTYASKRALQSARGHMTRELIDELQEEITRRWPDVTKVINYTREKTATEEGIEEWRMELRELGDRQMNARIEARGEKQRRPRFLRGNK